MGSIDRLDQFINMGAEWIHMVDIDGVQEKSLNHQMGRY